LGKHDTTIATEQSGGAETTQRRLQKKGKGPASHYWNTRGFGPRKRTSGAETMIMEAPKKK